MPVLKTLLNGAWVPVSGLSEHTHTINDITDFPEELATEKYVDNKVASMVDSAPETLDTLNELAAALGDDPNFATTVATQIGTIEADVASKLPLAGGTLDSKAVIKFSSGAGTISEDDYMGITYGRISSKGNLCINANHDNSSTQYAVITSGKGFSSSTADGLAVGSNTLTWKDSDILTESNYSSHITELNYLDGITSNIQTQLDNKATTNDLSALQTLVGDTKVSEQISEAINNLEIPEGFSGSWNDLTDKPFGEVGREYIMTPCQLTTTYEAMGGYYGFNDLEIAPGALVAGETYVVSFNGTDYILEAYENTYNTGSVCLGNMDLSGYVDVYENTGEPFAFLVQVDAPWHQFFTDGEGTYTVSIEKATGGLSQLDEKYIPDTISRVSDVNAAISEKAPKSHGIHYIEGTGTTAGTWLGNHEDITEYYSGLVLAYKIGIAGLSSKTTLNINNLGAVTVVKNATSAISTNFAVNSVIFLVYTIDSDGTAYWKAHDYDSSTKTTTGTSNKASTKLFLTGATSQTSSGTTTYSNKNVYIGTDNCLYSNGEKVATSTEVSAVSDLIGDTSVSEQITDAINSYDHSWDNLTGKPSIPPSTTSVAHQYALSNSNVNISDVTTWISVTSPLTQRERSCIFANGYYVVCGVGGEVGYSKDGITWTKITPFVSGTLTNIAYGKGKFIIVDEFANLWMAEETPITWTKIRNGEEWGTDIGSITYANNQFVVAGNFMCAFSENGIAWTQVEAPGEYNQIAFGNGRYVAVGGNGAIGVSYDGKSWIDVSNPAVTGDLRAVTYAKGKYIIGGIDGLIMYTEDFVTWSTATSNSTGVRYVRQIVYAENKYYAACYTSSGAGEIWVSEDGVTWTVQQQMGTRLWCLNYNDGKLIAAGDSGSIYILNLGIEWLNYKPDANEGQYIWERIVFTLSDSSIILSDSVCIESGDIDIVSKWIGDKTVSDQISDAINNITYPVTSVNNKTGVITLEASDVKAVPTSRTINGKALSSNISLTAADVNALPADTKIPSITGLATESYVNNKIAEMINSAPETLDTLNELATALGNDPNFATTITNLIAQKSQAQIITWEDDD